MHSWAAARWGLPAQSSQVAAARVAAVDARFAPAASWSEIGAWRQVAAAGGPDPSLAALLADPVLTRTAATWLDCAGSPQRAAAQLCIHRQTLYYRLGRVQELTGLDLADGADRLLLHLGVRAACLTPLVGAAASHRPDRDLSS
jgi:hypothetical protein